MNFDAEEWSLFEKAHDHRFLLRFLGSVLVADQILAVATDGLMPQRSGITE